MQLFRAPLTRHFVLATALMATIGQNAMAKNDAEVIVYGSTPGGFCAAIAAARTHPPAAFPPPTSEGTMRALPSQRSAAWRNHRV